MVTLSEPPVPSGGLCPLAQPRLPVCPHVTPSPSLTSVRSGPHSLPHLSHLVKTPSWTPELQQNRCPPGDVARSLQGQTGRFWKISKVSKAKRADSNGCVSGREIPGRGSPQRPCDSSEPSAEAAPRPLAAHSPQSSGSGCSCLQVSQPRGREWLLLSSLSSLESPVPALLPPYPPKAQHYPPPPPDMPRLLASCSAGMDPEPGGRMKALGHCPREEAPGGRGKGLRMTPQVLEEVWWEAGAFLEIHMHFQKQNKPRSKNKPR